MSFKFVQTSVAHEIEKVFKFYKKQTQCTPSCWKKAPNENPEQNWMGAYLYRIFIVCTETEKYYLY